MTIHTVMGTLGTVLLTTSLIPQIIYVSKTKDMTSFSLQFLSMVVIGLLSMLIFRLGIVLGDDTVSLSESILLLVDISVSLSAWSYMLYIKMRTCHDRVGSAKSGAGDRTG